MLALEPDTSPYTGLDSLVTGCFAAVSAIVVDGNDGLHMLTLSAEWVGRSKYLKERPSTNS